MPYPVAGGPAATARDRCLVAVLAAVLVLAVLVPPAGAAEAPRSWVPIGPEGGCVAQVERLADGRFVALTCGGDLYVAGASLESWTRLGRAPEAGSDHLVVPHPSDPDVLFASTLQAAPTTRVQARLYRSEDLGAHWQELHAEERGAARVGGLLALPGGEGGGPTLLWALTALNGPGAPPAVLWRSDDGGASWQEAGEGLPGSAYEDLAALRAQPSVVYALGGDEQPVFRSDDGGLSFQPAGAGLPVARGGRELAVAPAQPSRLYLVLEGGTFYRSDDGGASWHTAGTSLPLSGFDALDLRVDPLDPDRVYVLRNRELRVSDDAARSFQRLAVPPAGGAGAGPAPAVGAYLPFVGGVLVATTGPTAGFGTPGGLALSRDAGDTWSYPNDGLFAGSLVDLATVPAEPARLYAATRQAVLVWRQHPQGWRTLPVDAATVGLPFSRLNAVFANPYDRRHLVAATDEGLAESRDGGASWQGQRDFCVSFEAVAFLPGTDGGLVASGLYDDSTCQVRDECALFRRDAFGEALTCLREPGESPNTVVGLEVSAAQPERWYAHHLDAYTSADAGATWGPLPSPPGAGPARVTALAAHPFEGDALWLGLDNGELWASPDAGASWELRSPPAGWAGEPPPADAFGVDGRVQRIRVDPVDPRHLYVVAEGRVWASDDGGGEWELLATGLEERPVLDLELDPADPATLYAVVEGAGAWRLDRLLPAAPCTAEERTLCLGPGGRFRVQAAWRDFQDGVGVGRGQQRTTQTGTFRFFDGDNTELVVKVLDGRPVNDRWWVFYAALSNVPYTLVVTDTQTGESVGYYNPERRFASRGDTAAFPEGGPEVVAEPAPAAPPLRSFVTPQPCVASPTVLCLADGRFQVEADWEDFFGNTGEAMAIPDESAGGGFSDGADTGYLWFFAAGNYELAVKVIDGRELNGHWWVFQGSLSNVAYTLRVTDTQTGEVLEYVNPEGAFASRGDTRAFDAVP